MEILQINDANFESEVQNSDKPILCDFWAEWCGPCKQITPILEDIAKEYAEKITVAKVNIDDNPEIPSKYGIMSIPTLILFKKGEAVGTQVGLQDKSSLSSWLDSFLS